MFRHRCAAAAAVVAGVGVAARKTLSQHNTNFVEEEEGGTTTTTTAAQRGARSAHVAHCEPLDPNAAFTAAAAGVGVGLGAAYAVWWWSSSAGNAAATMAELWAVLEQGDAATLRRLLTHTSPTVQVAVAADDGSSNGDAADTTTTTTTPNNGHKTERRLRHGVFDLLQYAVVRGDVESTTAVLEWIEVSQKGTARTKTMALLSTSSFLRTVCVMWVSARVCVCVRVRERVGVCVCVNVLHKTLTAP